MKKMYKNKKRNPRAKKENFLTKLLNTVITI